MADIFLSYASGDRERVRPLVEALMAQGWSVWWDRHIQPGQSFDNVIQRELDAARCVIVVWSEQSVESEWVKNEATIGLNRGILVPALLDQVQIPLPFVRTHSADLVDWSADTLGPEIREFLNAVSGHLDAEPKELQLPASKPRRRPRRRWVAAGVSLALVVALGALLLRGARISVLFEETPDNSVAVIPFEDLTPTHNEQWIGGAIVSTLRIGLPGQGLQVIGARSYQQAEGPPQEINARYRIQGSVMRLRTMIRVTAELVLEENDHQLWADEFIAYEDDITSDLSAQNEIAGKIIRAVASQIDAGESPALASAKAKAKQKSKQGALLQNVLEGDEGFGEFPSFDEEGFDE